MEEQHLLVMRMESLIGLLGVCPKCVKGFVGDSPLRKDNQHQSMPAIASVTNTWDTVMTKRCSNPACDFKQTFPNPHYKALPLAPEKKADSDPEMGNDLFG